MRGGWRRFPAFKILVFLAIVCVSLEGASRWAVSSPDFLKRIARDDSSAWQRLRWVSRHRDQDRLTSPFDVYDSQRGWAVRPGVPRSRAFGNHWLSTNSRGLRGSQEYDYEKTPGRMRIATIGDSFTFGEQVSDDQTFAALLQEQMADVEVLNFGVHGYGHDQMVLYLQSDVVKYRPDIVLLGFLQADMSRNRLSFRDFAKPMFELRDGTLRLRHSPVPSPAEVLRAEPYRLKTFDVLDMLWTGVRGRSRHQRAYEQQLTTALLDEMLRTIAGIGARPLFVYLPQRNEVRNPEHTRPTPGEAFLLRFCGARKIDCVSLRPPFLESASDPTALRKLFRWGHWSQNGHRIAAQVIADELAKRGIARKRESAP